jgi:hypothetical protein
MLWNICTTLSVVFTSAKILFIIVSPASWVVRSISDTASLTTIILSIRFGQSLTRTAETESLVRQEAGVIQPVEVRPG